MKIPNVSFRLWVDKKFSLGFMVRTIKTGLGREHVHVLSRKSGRWIKVTAEQVKEQDIPNDCWFPGNDLPQNTVESEKIPGS